MAPTLSALKLFMTAIIGAEPWRRDPLVLRKRWSEDDYHLREHGEGKGPLCFGIIWHDDYAMPHPPVLRALEETKQALIKAGHKGEWDLNQRMVERLTHLGLSRRLEASEA
jgi:amidase